MLLRGFAGTFPRFLQLKNKGRGLLLPFLNPSRQYPLWVLAIPQRGGFSFLPCPKGPEAEAQMDKDRKEALQVAKELTAKFIETRTVSPGNFAEVFPSVYRVVCAAIGVDADQDNKGK